MKCLISLAPLTEQNTIQEEYSKKAVIELTGGIKNTIHLPFTRASFVQEQPSKQQGMSLSGYQPKLSLAINDNREFEVVETLGQYILKPSPERFPYLSENEHASMLVMKKLGFQIPPFGLTRFMSDEHGVEEMSFVIKRYDRTEDGERIHQEQLDSAMEINNKYGKTEGDDHQYVSYEQIGRYLVDNIDSSLAMKRDFFLRVAVSYIIGNNDLHLRNFGIIYPNDEPPRLAPIYDYVSVAPYPEYNGELLALPLLIKQEGPDGEIPDGFSTAEGQYIGHDFIEFGVGIGLNKKAAQKYLNDLIKMVPAIIDGYERSFVQNPQLELILGCVHQRSRSLGVTEFKPI
jgi:serine/threonine-protein kinase HipA